MTPEETAALLMWIAGHDNRHSVGSGEEAELRRRVWAKLTTEVPFDFAREAVDRHYSRSDAEVIKPAHVLTAWRNSQRVAEARERPEPVLFGSKRAPEGFAAMVAESTARWQVARQAAPGSELWRQQRAEAQAVDAAVSVPWDVVRVRDERERRCANHDICVCTHDACRDGWLDTEQDGDVVRCPICREAGDMRSELTPRRRGRR